ncbi:MAG: BlaI/MecI/CopY family transcriptional regulator [Niabella sp.]
MAQIKAVKPTESELEILQVLWSKGKATVRDVHEVLLTTRDIGYTTTLKLMQIMFEKGLVTRDASNRTHIYTAACNKEKTQKQLLGKFISNLFGGSSSQLVLQTLGTHKITEKELDDIQHLIDQLKKENT